MLVIRLARTGKKKQAYFRIVVADKRRAVGAKFVEILGNYNPHQKKLELNQEKLNEYMKNGAQPSNTLAKILKKEGIKLPKWVCITEKNRPSKKVEEPKEEIVKAKSTEEKPSEEVALAEETSETETKIVKATEEPEKGESMPTEDVTKSNVDEAPAEKSKGEGVKE